eukprot:Tamp_07137.p1 GENE.Tamp_07137~~Tamp_07137.p1  ORF type:complete len:555 (+),score=69.93 Tamp_07137:323-1987(+)
MSLPECPTLHPTAEEWHEDFEGVIRKAEHMAVDSGIVKIVPPACWKAFPSMRSKYKAIEDGSLDFTLPSPIRQHPLGQQGVYKLVNMVHKETTLQKYKKLAQQPENAAPRAHERELGDPYAALHRKFWSSLGTQAMSPPLYASDVADRSLFAGEAGPWDLRGLDTLLQRSIPRVDGVTHATLFVGMWRSTFAWHTEDYDLHALNFHHMGEPKVWYGVPGASKQRFQAMCAQRFPGEEQLCPEFVRHKNLLVAPAIAKEHAIPVFRCVQRPGEFVMTMPAAFHCGFNCGFNCAEACNFALSSWVPFGVRSRQCSCSSAQAKVTIDMRVFASHSAADTDASTTAHAVQAWKEGDIVWAQVPGYPPWPAMIRKAESEPQKKEMEEKASATGRAWYCVSFFETEDWGVIPPWDISVFPGPEAIEIKGMKMAQKQNLGERLQCAMQLAREARAENDLFVDVACQVCDSRQDEESMVLCDMCDAGYHLNCLEPKLLSVPRGDWLCPECTRTGESKDLALCDDASCSRGEVSVSLHVPRKEEVCLPSTRKRGRRMKVYSAP